MPELLIARQPIYNRTQHVFGYELLYQPGKDSNLVCDSDDAAASQVVIDALTEIGVDNLVAQRKVFVRLSRGFISGKYPLPLPENRLIVEVPAAVGADADVIDGIKFLARQGYSIALADYVYSEAGLPLLALANIVKVDVQALSEEELRYHFSVLQEHSHLKLLADNIEIPDEYEVCKELGFNYFQGHFFSRPKLVRRTRMPSNQLALMRLLAEVQRPDVNIPKLEAMISQDVGLSYKLLRYINSAFFGLPKPVESIQRAVVFLGTQVIQKWTTLLVLSRVEDKPAELMVTAVVRAKMCEILAKAVEYEHEDTCFTVGLLSVLEALLDMPMEKVLAMLTLTDEVNQALLRFDGVPGKLLKVTQQYEFGDWQQLDYPELEEDIIMDAYLQSIAWASEACSALLGD